jgi:hypothetical protein
MNNFNGQVPTVYPQLAGEAAILPTANDLTLAQATNAAAKTLYGLIANLAVFNSAGRVDANRIAAAQATLLSVQPLFTQADCTAAGVVFTAWSGQINWQTALTQAQSLIASGF